MEGRNRYQSVRGPSLRGFLDSRWVTGPLGTLIACMLCACAGAGPLWEQRLAAAHRVDPDVTEEVLPFGLWLPVHAKGAFIQPLSVAYELSMEGDAESALELVTQLARENPGEASLLAASAALQRLLGFSRAAEYELSRALELDRGDAAIAMGLAELRLELGFPTAAIEALGRAHDAGRDDAKLHGMLGRAWARLGQGADARRHFDAAIERSGLSSVATHLLAAEAMMEGPHALQCDPEACRWVGGVLDEAVERAPLNARAWYLRGRYLERRGERTSAMDSFELACEQEPWNGSAWTRLALLSLELRDRERFDLALAKALALEGNRRRMKRLAALSHQLESSVALLEGH